jgi:exodeoxyribonuclease VII large subunit
MTNQRAIYTPSELNREAKLHLEAGFSGIWLEGEISNLSRPASGHLYFSLKDDRAQIGCALFRSDAMKLAFRPQDGQLVRARGRLSLYEPQGRYQLIAEHMEEAGEGRLRAAFEALKAQLEREGLFAPEHKQALPAYPQRISVITSPSGAVIRDIVHVLERRWPLAAVRLYPVPVQGKEAPAAICRALHAANRHGWGQAIILGRGGGSLEDLWGFNDEAVARAVFASAIPVISAVGHETDFSISDFVADVRAPTPSAAAELLAPDQDALRRSFQLLEQRLARRVQDTLQRLAQQQDHLAHRLSRQHPVYRLQQFGQTLDQYRARLAASGKRLVSPKALAVAQQQERLYAAARRLLPERQHRLAELARTLHALSPLPTLERGYAVVTQTQTGRVISSIGDVSAGDAISAQLHDGRIHSTVERISEEGLDPEPS